MTNSEESRELPRFLLKALEAAKLSECRFSHGAVLTKGGKIISIASNRNRNVPGHVDISETSFHAEVAAIKQVKNPRGSVLYVARYSRRDGGVTMSRPCSGCWVAIEKAEISKVIYSTWGNRHAIERV